MTNKLLRVVTRASTSVLRANVISLSHVLGWVMRLRCSEKLVQLLKVCSTVLAIREIMNNRKLGTTAYKWWTIEFYDKDMLVYRKWLKHLPTNFPAKKKTPIRHHDLTNGTLVPRLPEPSEQVNQIDLLWIENHLDCLGAQHRHAVCRCWSKMTQGRAVTIYLTNEYRTSDKVWKYFSDVYILVFIICYRHGPCLFSHLICHVGTSWSWMHSSHINASACPVLPVTTSS